MDLAHPIIGTEIMFLLMKNRELKFEECSIRSTAVERREKDWYHVPQSVTHSVKWRKLRDESLSQSVQLIFYASQGI